MEDNVFHGIFRNVTLWSAPQTHMRDFFVKQDLDKEYKNATLEIVARVKNYSTKKSKGQSLTATLYDKQGNEITKKTVSGKALLGQQEQQLAVKMDVMAPEKWTAETPNLYTVVLSNSEGEILSSKIGFRKLEINGRIMTVNGVPLKLKGVNRHDRYIGRGMMNRFVDDTQVSVIGSANNVNDQGFSGGGGGPRWRPNNGLNAPREYGINFATQNSKIELGGSARFNSNGSDIASINSSERFLQSGKSFSNSNSHALFY